MAQGIKPFITWQIRNSFGVFAAVAFVGGTCRPTTTTAAAAAARCRRRLLLPSETSSSELFAVVAGDRKRHCAKERDRDALSQEPKSERERNASKLR